MGGWLVLALAVAQQKEQAGRGPHNPIQPPSSDLRIMMIQSGFQSAMEDLSTPEMRTLKGRDEDGKPFTIKVPAKMGANKTPSFTMLHDGILRSSNVPMASGSMKYDLQFFSFSQEGKPLQEGSLKFRQQYGNFPKRFKPSETQEIVSFANKSVAQLKSIDQVKGTVNGLEAEARPLRVTKKECLKCHSDSKVGDPLAILVYVVKKNQ